MDRFKISLECPNCRKVGIAHAEEEEGWAFLKGNQATSICSLPSGFKIVNQRSKRASVDIFCEDCDVSAIQ